jgi:hypothetical protein
MVDLARWRCGHFPGLGHVGLQGHVNHRYQHDQAHSLPRVQHRYALVVNLCCIICQCGSHLSNLLCPPHRVWSIDDGADRIPAQDPHVDDPLRGRLGLCRGTCRRHQGRELAVRTRSIQSPPHLSSSYSPQLFPTCVKQAALERGAELGGHPTCHRPHLCRCIRCPQGHANTLRIGHRHQYNSTAHLSHKGSKQGPMLALCLLFNTFHNKIEIYLKRLYSPTPGPSSGIITRTAIWATTRCEDRPRRGFR